MTCIVALKHGSTIYMGADNIASDDMGIYARQNEKIFWNGDFLIGVAGSPRVAQILQYCVNFPGQTSQQDDLAFMVDVFVEHTRQALSMRGAMLKESEEEFNRAQYLIAYRENIYVVDRDWHIMIPRMNYASIGSGELTAQGALYALAPGVQVEGGSLHAKDVLQIALDAASEHCVGVRGPYTFAQTSDTDITTADE